MKSVRLIGLMLFISCHVMADIIVNPYAYQDAALSIEGIVGVEQPFSKHKSANFWGGFGAVSFVDKLDHPALKGETCSLRLSIIFQHQHLVGLILDCIQVLPS